jgi:hypothetical protein
MPWIDSSAVVPALNVTLATEELVIQGGTSNSGLHPTARRTNTHGPMSAVLQMWSLMAALPVMALAGP